LFEALLTHYFIIPIFHDSIAATMGKTGKIILPDIKKVLIRSANWVGDAVMSLPAISSIRQSFPRAEIAILAKPWVAEIFRHSPIVDRIILYHGHGIHQGIQGKWRLAKELRDERFELALLLQNAFEAAFIAYLARIPRRAGYDTDGRRLLLTHAVTRNQEMKENHQIDYYLGMVESLGFFRAGRIPHLGVSPEKQGEACRMLHSLGIKETEEIIGISPGATYGSAKQWFPERYGQLAEKIGKELGARILIFGSDGDKKVALQVCHNSGVPLIDLTGLTNLSQAMALIARCRLFITNDSGLMHVAAALNTPLVALFGSTNHRRTGPRGGVCRVIHKSISCAPCMKAECPDRRQCMELISVEEVYEEAKAIWGLRA
jgi:heptosyltransferase-2